MKNLPHKIKVGGHILSIDCSKTNKHAMGEFDATTNTIMIGKNLTQSQKEATLLHEVLHAMNSTLGGHSQMGHCFLDGLSEQLYAFLKDNKLWK